MTSRTLRMLYRQVPATSPCVAGCMDCCGPVPWTTEEAGRVQADLPPGALTTVVEGVVTWANAATGKCVFASPQGCRVYDRRPFMCRIFGAADAPILTCPHGVRAKRPLTDQQARRLTDAYAQEHTPQAEGITR